MAYLRILLLFLVVAAVAVVTMPFIPCVDVCHLTEGWNAFRHMWPYDSALLSFSTSPKSRNFKRIWPSPKTAIINNMFFDSCNVFESHLATGALVGFRQCTQWTVPAMAALWRSLHMQRDFFRFVRRIIVALIRASVQTAGIRFSRAERPGGLGVAFCYVY